jgi:transposase InsO family protein
MEMNIVLDTVVNMVKNLTASSLCGALIHSDQGVHYTNPEYINAIKKLNMVQSISRKGRCIDNAPTESFFGHLKDDVDYGKCKTFEELRGMIAAYIDYYNNDRPQWELKKMTPVAYRNHLLLVQK